jgi:putative nucleotidyltransferase with HDIG domain
MITTIQALASAIDAKDQYTHAHSARVAQLVLATARELGITDPETCREVELAGLLHDIGKIGIPDAILTKAGRLTPEEFATVQRHTEIGAGIVRKVEGMERVAQAVRHHHERYDGLGYPLGLARDAIPVTSRMIAIADVFDVLTSDRPYRKAVGVEEAVLEINRFRGTQFDPAIVDAFQRVISRELERVGNGNGMDQGDNLLLTPSAVTSGQSCQ